MLAAATLLALGCLAIVYSAEIVAMFGRYAMWLIAGLAVLVALNVIVGMALEWILCNPELRQPSAAWTTLAGSTGVGIASPTSPTRRRARRAGQPPARSRLTAL